ncbi:MAG: DNA alkylation repair protein [Candidatus Bathyarchaeota archaeon]|nr:DNA alkylation repair protein [Candidatus Bathyarchaeota archaeon]
MHPVVGRVRAELQEKADEQVKQGFRRFFKEEATFYGVKTPVVRKTAAKYWKEIKTLPKTEVFTLCETLYQSGVMEEATVAGTWLSKITSQLEPSDLNMFEQWIKRYVDNWAKCDDLCNHIIGAILEKYPKTASQVAQWAKSDNRWLKRASAVSFIIPAKKGKFLQQTLQITTTLLNDPDDLVQKGYGWLLKEQTKTHQQQILQYVLQHKNTMPRTALRYAIEKMPQNLKTQAMQKD